MKAAPSYPLSLSLSSNCRTEWAAEEGQDFIADHSSPAIDFATIHAWVRRGAGSKRC